jgi:serine phosphatase RsbU (regulator of sigma subunit)
MKFNLFFFLVLFTTISFGSNVDSLKLVLENQPNEDTLRLKTLINISNACIDEKIVDSYQYAQEAALIATKLDRKEYIALSNRLIAKYFDYVAENNDSAVYYYNIALEKYKEADDMLNVGSMFYSIGVNYISRPDYRTAIEYFLRSYEILKDLDDKVELLNCVSLIATSNYNISEFDQAIKFDSIGLLICREIDAKAEEANFLNNMAAVYKRKGNLERALVIFHESLVLSKEVDNKSVIAYTSNNMANVYADYGDYPKALEHYLLTLKSCEELENIGCIATSYNNIAILYYTQKDYKKTVEYLFKSLDTYKIAEDEDGIANVTNNIAELYMEQDSLQKSLEYYNTSLPIIQKLNSRYLLYYNYTGQAAVYDRLKEYSKAESLYFKGLETAKEINARYEIAHSYEAISSHYLLKNKYKLAQTYADSALALGQEIGIPEIIKDAADVLHQSNAQLRGFKKAYEYHLLYTEMNDSILSDNNTKEVTQLVMQYQHDKELKEREIEQAKKDLAKEKELSRQKNLRNIFFIAFAFVLLMVFIVLKNYREKKKANELLSQQKAEIEEKNEELNQLNHEISRQKDELEKNHKKITDSIKYAEKIQTAMLPMQNTLERLLPKHFILYQPRDIVSGDFYWVRQVDDVILIAVADCTGHGVPGAMMSMLGISFLNDISRRKEVNKPSLILSELRNQVKKSLKQTGKRDEARDGMDMAFCEIDTKTNKLCFAGANNPLILFRNGELIQYKADRQPISIYFKEKEFTDHSIQLEKGDRIYMFSDGFMDQINMDNRKKFSSHGLRTKLEELHLKPMTKQKEILESTINDWMGESTNQVDDILIMGIEI